MKKIIPVILAGEVRPSLLRRQTGLLPLEIPLRPGWTNLDAWLKCLRASSIEHRTTVLVSSAHELRQLRSREVHHNVDLMVDQRSHRGTGGILADFRLAHRGVQAEDAAFLMIEGNCLAPPTLEPLVNEFHRTSAAIAFGTFSRDRLRGVCLVAESSLNLVPDVGFFDLKEQLVMAIRQSGGKVIGADLNDPLLRLTSLSSLLEAIARISGEGPEYAREDVILTADNCIHDIEWVGSGAGIVNSLLMPGVKVGDGAIVARSFVGSGVEIPPGQRVIDAVIASPHVAGLSQRDALA